MVTAQPNGSTCYSGEMSVMRVAVLPEAATVRALTSGHGSGHVPAFAIGPAPLVKRRPRRTSHGPAVRFQGT